MRLEDIHEPVEMIALFRLGKLLPLKFRWRERVYRVERINGNWTTDEGALRIHHFAVAADGPDIFDLSYNERAHSWKLEKVSLAG